MKLHQLRDFTAVATTGSLRAAARKLGLAQPSLTKSLQQLEKELGYALFERTARGVVLSAAGRSFLPRAEAVLNELQRGVSELRELSGDGGRVNMAISAAVSLTCLADSLKSFRSSFPEASVRIIAGQYPVMFPELRSGNLDFFIGPRPQIELSDEFAVEELFKNTRSVICRLGHPLQQAKSLSDLVKAQWLVSGATGLASSEHDQLFSGLGLPVPQSTVQCEYGTALLALLTSTDMLSIMPRQWAETSVLSGLLGRIDVDEPIAGADIILIYKAGLPLAPAAAHMLTLLKRNIEFYIRHAGNVLSLPP
jgi:LysR family transcriptional regulator of abg operon